MKLRITDIQSAGYGRRHYPITLAITIENVGDEITTKDMEHIWSLRDKEIELREALDL